MSAHAPTTALSGGFSYSELRAADTNYPTTIEPLAPGTSGTFQALDAMRSAVRGEVPPDYSGCRDPEIKQAAISIVGKDRGADRNEIATLFDFVAHRIHYLDHPPQMQIVQDAKRTIEIGSGDCVSKSVLLATLLASLGYQPYFIAQYISDDEGYGHVYVALDMNGETLRLDPVASDSPMGWSQKLQDGGFETSYPIFR